MNEPSEIKVARVARAHRWLLVGFALFVVGALSTQSGATWLALLSPIPLLIGYLLGLLAGVAICIRVWNILALPGLALMLVFPFGIVALFAIAGMAAIRFLHQHGLKPGLTGVTPSMLSDWIGKRQTA